MKKKIEILYIFKLEPLLSKLITSDIGYSIDVAFRIKQLNEDVTKMVDYTLSRLNILCGDGINFMKMDKQERLVYDSLMIQKVSLDTLDLCITDIINNNLIAFDDSEIEILSKVFD